MNVSKKIKCQKLVLSILQSLKEEYVQKLTLRVNYGQNVYCISLSNSLVCCYIKTQPTDIELDLFRGAVCDVDLKDAILFSVINNGYRITNHKRLVILVTDVEPVNDSFIAIDKSGTSLRNNGGSIPNRMFYEFEKLLKSGEFNLSAHMAESYRDFDKAYNSRMRAFLRIASKYDIQFLEEKNLVLVTNVINMLDVRRDTDVSQELSRIITLNFFNRNV